MEVPVGIAPTHGGFADPCLTAWLRHQHCAPHPTLSRGEREHAHLQPTTYSLQPPHLLLRPECHPIQDEKYLFLKIALRRERERCGHRVTDLPHHRAQLVKPLRRLFRDWLGGERV